MRQYSDGLSAFFQHTIGHRTHHADRGAAVNQAQPAGRKLIAQDPRGFAVDGAGTGIGATIHADPFHGVIP